MITISFGHNCLIRESSLSSVLIPFNPFVGNTFEIFPNFEKGQVQNQPSQKQQLVSKFFKLALILKLTIFLRVKLLLNVDLAFLCLSGRYFITDFTGNTVEVCSQVIHMVEQLMSQSGHTHNNVQFKNLAQRGYNTGHFVWLSLIVGLLIYNIAFQSLFLIWNGLLFIIWLSIFAL